MATEIQYLNASEAAQLLGVTTKTATLWFQKGVFPNAFQQAKTIRIPLTDIEAAKKQPWKDQEGGAA